MKRYGVRPSFCLTRLAPQPRRAAGLLLSAVRAGDIDRQLRAAAPRIPAAGALSSNGAAARRSAANAGSVIFDSRGTRLIADL